MRILVVASMLLMTALAGCTSGDDGPVDVGTGGGNDDGLPAQTDMPEWAVGDWWEYRVQFPGGTNQWTLAVSESSGSDWIIDTDDEDLAFFHSTFGEISYLGAIAKNDLSGEQEGTTVKFFDWPLEDQKQWNADWDGQRLQMTAHAGDQGRFHIMGHTPDAMVVQYEYNPARGWFEWVSWADAEGNEYARIDIVDSGSGYIGSLVRTTGTLIESASYSGVASQTLEFMDVSASTDSDAYIFFSATCTQGAFEFGLGTVQSAVDSSIGLGMFPDQGFTIAPGQCPQQIFTASVIGEEPDSGDNWGYFIFSQSPDLQLDFQLYVRDFERITL